MSIELLQFYYGDGRGEGSMSVIAILRQLREADPLQVADSRHTSCGGYFGLGASMGNPSWSNRKAQTSAPSSTCSSRLELLWPVLGLVRSQLFRPKYLKNDLVLMMS
jgi:hypothetical protein